MQSTEFAALIKSRRSIRNWQDKPVPEQVLLDAVELATWAPNGGNRQNWRFFLVLNRNTIKALSDAVQAGAGGPRPAPPPGSPPPAPRAPLSSAPAVIAIGTTRNINPQEEAMAKQALTDPKAAAALKALAAVDTPIQSIAAAITTLLLALHQAGLGAVWMCGPLTHCKGEFERILKVPPGMDIVAYIPVGYPAESPTKDRKPVSEVCQIIR